MYAAASHGPVGDGEVALLVARFVCRGKPRLPVGDGVVARFVCRVKPRLSLGDGVVARFVCRGKPRIYCWAMAWRLVLYAAASRGTTASV